MSSIPVAICRFSDNNFKRFYLEKKRHFVDFLLLFRNCAWNLEHSEKKEEYPNLINTEIFVDFLLLFRTVHEIWNILKKKKSILI